MASSAGDNERLKEESSCCVSGRSRSSERGHPAAAYCLYYLVACFMLVGVSLLLLLHRLIV